VMKHQALEATGIVYVNRGGGEASSREAAVARDRDVDFGRRSNAAGSTRLRNK
jgi:hypothetical protein